MIETLAEGFRKWGKMKPGRYKKFFKIVDEEVARRESAFEAYHENLEKTNVPKGIGGMNWQAQQTAL